MDIQVIKNEIFEFTRKPTESQKIEIINFLKQYIDNKEEKNIIIDFFDNLYSLIVEYDAIKIISTNCETYITSTEHLMQGLVSEFESLMDKICKKYNIEPETLEEIVGEYYEKFGFDIATIIINKDFNDDRVINYITENNNESVLAKYIYLLYINNISIININLEQLKKILNFDSGYKLGILNFISDDLFNQLEQDDIKKIVQCITKDDNFKIKIDDYINNLRINNASDLFRKLSKDRLKIISKYMSIDDVIKYLCDYELLENISETDVIRLVNLGNFKILNYINHIDSLPINLDKYKEFYSKYNYDFNYCSINIINELIKDDNFKQIIISNTPEYRFFEYFSELEPSIRGKILEKINSTNDVKVYFNSSISIENFLYSSFLPIKHWYVINFFRNIDITNIYVKDMLNFIDSFYYNENLPSIFETISIDNISKYFTGKGASKALINYYLRDYEDLVYIFINNDSLNCFNISDEEKNKLKCYIDFIEKMNSRNNSRELIGFIETFDDINNYFGVEEINKQLIEKSLFDEYLFSVVLRDNNYDFFNENTKRYIEFIRKFGFILSKYINSNDDILLYFSETGINEILYEKMLNDYEIFEALYTIYIEDEKKNNLIKYNSKTIEIFKLFHEILKKYTAKKDVFFKTNVGEKLGIDEILFIIKNSDMLDNYLTFNSELFDTLNPLMLNDEFREISSDLFQKILLHPYYQKILTGYIGNKNYLDVIIKMLKKVNEISNDGLDTSEIIGNILIHFDQYSNLFDNTSLNESLNDSKMDNLIYLLQNSYLKIIYPIKSVNDLSDINMKKMKNAYLDSFKKEIHNINNINILRKSVLLKLYDLSVEDAEFLVSRYCFDIDSLKNNNNIDSSLKNILLGLYSICDENTTINKLKTMFLTYNPIIKDYKTTILLDSIIRKEYARIYNSELYHVKPEHDISLHPELIQNPEALNKMNELIDEYSINIYMMDGDFKMQACIPGALEGADVGYRSENKKQDWNRPIIKNMSISSSLISNDMIALAKKNSYALAFSSYNGDELLMLDCQDLGSLYFRENFSVSRGKEGNFFLPEDLKDNTRNYFNEILISRLKVENGQLVKKQPDYILYIVDDLNNIDEAYNCNMIEAAKAAKDFGIPLVIVDHTKYSLSEHEKCDSLYQKFKKTFDIEILNKLFLKFFNNMMSCYHLKNNLFSISKFNDFYKCITDIIETRTDMEKVVLYDALLTILDIEDKKRQLRGSDIICPFSDTKWGKYSNLKNNMNEIQERIKNLKATIGSLDAANNDVGKKYI